MSNEITYRIEYDLYQDCIERIARKIEAEGEEALALALKEHGFEKVVRCRDCKHFYEDRRDTSIGWVDVFVCDSEQWSTSSLMPSHEVEPDRFCAWGEKAVKQ